MWEVLLTKEVQKQLNGIHNPTTRFEIKKKLASLRLNPEANKPLRRQLAGYYSLRAARNRYRIIYRIIYKRVVVLVVMIGLRKDGDFADVYRKMARNLKQKALENENKVNS